MTYSGGKRNVSFIPTKSFGKYSKYLVQLLKNKKFEEFSNHMNPIFFPKSCKVSVKTKVFDCGNILSHLISNKDRSIIYCILLFSNWNSALNNLTLNNKEGFKSLEKIVIKFRKFEQIRLTIFYSHDNEYVLEKKSENSVFPHFEICKFLFRNIFYSETKH
jgi:hypothetical protein